jgi:cell wall-associated NlpC family hydrolase
VDRSISNRRSFSNLWTCCVWKDRASSLWQSSCAKERATRGKTRDLGSQSTSHKRYRYGGGHKSFDDRGYDCSGTISYVLGAAA